MANATVVPGNRYGKLVVIGLVEVRDYHRYMLCLCDCGNSTVVRANSLTQMNTKSCGCLSLSGLYKIKHGESSTAEYFVWQGIFQRCYNKKFVGYKNWGGRGIRVCKRWWDYENFKLDMGLRPSSKHSIDRINNDLNYEPSNCRWATRSQQNSNRRRYRKGETVCRMSR